MYDNKRAKTHARKEEKPRKVFQKRVKARKKERVKHRELERKQVNGRVVK